MQKSLYFLILNAFLVAGCVPNSTSFPDAKSEQAQETEQTAKPEQPQEPEQTAEPTQPQEPKQTAEPERPGFPFARFFADAASDSQWDALRKRQEKAEKLADDKKFDEAVQEADYVVSSILATNRHQSGGEDKSAEEYATLLKSAFATLDKCARRAEATQRPVVSSEPTSVRL